MLNYWKAYWLMYFALRAALKSGNVQTELLTSFLCKPYHDGEAKAEINRLADTQAYTMGGRNASIEATQY